MNNLRIGIGYDVHAAGPGRELVLGGVRIESPFGLIGHSDADVLVHAIIDSLLGPSGLGDIGMLFPDTDPAYRGARSIDLLSAVGGMLRESGITVINIDSVVVCETPRIAPHSELMRRNIATAVGGIGPELVGIKGKTSERLGFAGRGEGIAAQAVSLIRIG